MSAPFDHWNLLVKRSDTGAGGGALSRRADWRMPPLAELPRPRLTVATRAWMGVLRGYLVIAVLGLCG